MTHIGESAALYALGALSETERDEVDEHARSCAECRALVAGSERVVAELAQSEDRIEPSAVLKQRVLKSAEVKKRRLTPQFWAGAFAGMAAALVLALPGRMALQQTVDANDAALTGIVQSHFGHVPFTGLVPQAPKGKVIYARAGGWLYIVVHDPPRDATILLRTGGIAVNAGPLHVEGANGTLFIPSTPKGAVEVVLRDGGSDVARARILSAK